MKQKITAIGNVAMTDQRQRSHAACHEIRLLAQRLLRGEQVKHLRPDSTRWTRVLRSNSPTTNLLFVRPVALVRRRARQQVDDMAPAARLEPGLVDAARRC